MAPEIRNESLPNIELPTSYGELYAFVTVTSNGAFAHARYGLADNQQFHENEHILQMALSNPAAAREETALPAEVLKAAKQHVRFLEGKGEMQTGIMGYVSDLIGKIRTQGQRLIPGTRVAQDLS